MSRLQREYKVVGAILNKRGSVYEKLKKRYPNLMRYIEYSLDNKRCPFCNREFKTYYSLKNHINRGACGSMLSFMVELIEESASEEKVMNELNIDDEGLRSNILYYTYP